MKKAVLFFATLLTAGAMMAQTIVSTQVEKRNVLLEEFTGVGCGYCPDGHSRANAICAQYEGHAWAINIHAGGYASGSGYETEDGDLIHDEFRSQISGYPCGVVNRGSVQDRGQWAGTAASVRGENSPVNLAATATIDPMTRELNINVEVYYTGSQTATTNYLNVALVQDNILGPQSNYGNYNPDYIEGDLYRHMHMLRDMITDPWGEAITGLSAGTFYEKSYSYSIPASIGAVTIGDFADLEIIVFMNENHRNVITACKADVTVLPGAFVTGFEVQHSDCALEFQPVVSVRNTFDQTVESWEFLYDNQTLTFNEPVQPGNTASFYLPTYNITVSGDPVQHCATTKSVAMTSFTKNGEEISVSGLPLSATFAEFDIYTAAGPFVARAGVDAYASEGSVSLIDQRTCNALWTESFPYSDINTQGIQYISQLPDARFLNINFDPAAGLYIFRIIDSYGDGWVYTNNDNVSGFWLENAAGEIIAWPQGYSNGEEFSTKDFYLNVTSNGDGSHVGIEEVANVKVEIYPNPTTDRLNIECGQTISRIEVLDVAGRTVMSQNGNVNSINTKALAEGVYMLRVMTEAGVSAQKFVKE